MRVKMRTAPPPPGVAPLHGPSRSCATTDCAAKPQDLAAPSDRQSGRCASPERQNVHRPPVSHAHLRYGMRALGVPPESRFREPIRPPCDGSVHQTSPRPPARLFLKGYAAPHGGLQAAILVEHPDIALPDSLLDPRDVAARLLVHLEGAGIARPAGEHPTRPAVLLPCPDDCHHVDLATVIPQRLPEVAVPRAPGTERRRGSRGPARRRRRRLAGCPARRAAEAGRSDGGLARAPR